MSDSITLGRPRANFDLPRIKQHQLIPLVLALIVAALWSFPKFWYRSGPGEISYTEATSVPGFQFTKIPVEKSAERVLVADEITSREFFASNTPPVRVFSAKRLRQKQNEIGLFVHTPDRCWTEAGWRLDPGSAALIPIELPHFELPFERRIFSNGDARELVYFCGLVSGKPVPWRLDQNLSAALRLSHDTNGTTFIPASDSHFWKRLVESFTSRQALQGPQHFLRISTPVENENINSADHRLQSFITNWLTSPVNSYR